MILRMSDYPRTLLEFQRLFPDEAACAHNLEPVPFQPPVLADGGFQQRAEDRGPSEGADLHGFLRRRAGAYESCGIRRACANRIGMGWTR